MKLFDNLILSLEKLYKFIFLVKTRKNKQKTDLKKSYIKSWIIFPISLIPFYLIAHLNCIIAFLLFGLFFWIWLITVIVLNTKIKELKFAKKGENSNV